MGEAHTFDSHPQTLNIAPSHNGHHDDNLMSQTYDQIIASTDALPLSSCGGEYEAYNEISMFSVGPQCLRSIEARVGPGI